MSRYDVYQQFENLGDPSHEIFATLQEAEVAAEKFRREISEGIMSDPNFSIPTLGDGAYIELCKSLSVDDGDLIIVGQEWTDYGPEDRYELTPQGADVVASNAVVIEIIEDGD